MPFVVRRPTIASRFQTPAANFIFKASRCLLLHVGRKNYSRLKSFWALIDSPSLQMSREEVEKGKGIRRGWECVGIVTVKKRVSICRRGSPNFLWLCSHQEHYSSTAVTAMKPSLSLFTILSLSTTLSSSQLLFPQQQPFLPPSPSSTPTNPLRIAIIGAGAAGSSSAYFLSHFHNLPGLNLSTSVDIFDKNNYVGGRSTVIWPWRDHVEGFGRSGEEEEEEEEGGEDDLPVELGASIFVDANKNMVKAAKVFGLELVDNSDGGDRGMGIWDGEKFVYQEGRGGWGFGYWDLAKLLVPSCYTSTPMVILTTSQ